MTDDPSRAVPDIRDESVRLTAAAARAGVPIKLFGGMAVWLTCPSVRGGPFARPYADMDFAVTAAASKKARSFLEAEGYIGDQFFNRLHGATRLYYSAPDGGWSVDVIVDQLVMSHRLDLRTRLAGPGPTVPLADLLLTKLQIVEVNAKDLTDVLALLAHHSIGDADPIEQVDPGRLASVTGRDWGWYTTISDNLSRLEAYALAGVGIEETIRDAIVDRIHEVRAVIASAPHSIGWRSRAAIGRRMPWYELPEEVAGR